MRTKGYSLSSNNIACHVAAHPPCCNTATPCSGQSRKACVCKSCAPALCQRFFSSFSPAFFLRHFCQRLFARVLVHARPVHAPTLLATFRTCHAFCMYRHAFTRFCSLAPWMLVRCLDVASSLPPVFCRFCNPLACQCLRALFSRGKASAPVRPPCIIAPFFVALFLGSIPCPFASPAALMQRAACTPVFSRPPHLFARTPCPTA